MSWTKENSIFVTIGERCKYQRKLDYVIQYEHELVILPKFNHINYNQRWLSDVTCNKIYPGLTPKPNVTLVNKITVSINPTRVAIAVELTNDTVIHNKPIIDIDRYDSTRATYQDLMIKYTELFRTVQKWLSSVTRSVMSFVWLNGLEN